VLPCCPPCRIKVLRHLKGYPREPITIGHHLKQKRLKEKVLQQDLAEMLKVSKQTISNWEHGYTQPPLRQFKNISSFLGYCYFEKPATTIAMKIKNIRCYLFGMDVRSYAKFTNFDASTILAWENGKSRPNRKSLHKISLVCGVHLATDSKQHT